MQLNNILFLDIETVSNVATYDQLSDRFKALWQHKAKNIVTEEIPVDKVYEDKAAIFAEFGKVIVIGIGFFYNEGSVLFFKTKALYGHDEKELLQAFKVLLETKFDQRNLRLCAHNGREFDFPYLCRRMLANAVQLPEILKINDKKPWEINHLDTLEMWKFGDRKSYTSLELLAALFDIPTSKGELDGSMVGTAYYQENAIDKIAEYCKKDVVVLAQVFLALTCMPRINPSNILYL